jgi:hypothetical protein
VVKAQPSSSNQGQPPAAEAGSREESESTLQHSQGSGEDGDDKPAENSQQSAPNPWIGRWRQYIGPGMGFLASPLPKWTLKPLSRAFVMEGAAETSSLFSFGFSKLYSKIPFVPQNFATRKLTHMATNNTGTYMAYTTNVGRYIGRWGGKILGRFAGPLMLLDLSYSAYEGYQSATPEGKLYLANPYFYHANKMLQEDARKKR